MKNLDRIRRYRKAFPEENKSDKEIILIINKMNKTKRKIDKYFEKKEK